MKSPFYSIVKRDLASFTGSGERGGKGYSGGNLGGKGVTLSSGKGDGGPKEASLSYMWVHGEDRSLGFGDGNVREELEEGQEEIDYPPGGWVGSPPQIESLKRTRKKKKRAGNPTSDGRVAKEA